MVSLLNILLTLLIHNIFGCLLHFFEPSFSLPRILEMFIIGNSFRIVCLDWLHVNMIWCFNSTGCWNYKVPLKREISLHCETKLILLVVDVIVVDGNQRFVIMNADFQILLFGQISENAETQMIFAWEHIYKLFTIVVISLNRMNKMSTLFMSNYRVQVHSQSFIPISISKNAILMRYLIHAFHIIEAHTSASYLRLDFIT